IRLYWINPTSRKDVVGLTQPELGTAPQPLTTQYLMHHTREKNLTESWARIKSTIPGFGEEMIALAGQRKLRKQICSEVQVGVRGARRDDSSSAQRPDWRLHPAPHRPLARLNISVKFPAIEETYAAIRNGDIAVLGMDMPYLMYRRARFGVSSQVHWNQMDVDFNYRDFYWSVVDLLQGEEGQEILNRFNMPPCHYHGPTDFDILAAQRAVKSARKIAAAAESSASAFN
ncbi:hypothetical protein DFH08DRAFT_1015030, partial [Mycena albidolilacea]